MHLFFRLGASPLSPASVQDILRERYVKNSLFFQKNNPELAALLRERPSLFGLVVDNEGINIVHMPTSSLIYPKDENGHTAILACEEMAKYPFSHTKWHRGFSLNPFYMLESTLPLTGGAAKKILEVSFQTGQFSANDVTLPSGYFPSSVFYGLGGGFVLEAIAERYEEIESLCIYEPFVDLFCLSAFIVDYEIVFQKCRAVQLFVGETVPNTKDIRAFFAKNRFLTLYPRMELTLFNTPSLQEFSERVKREAGTLFRGFGSYEDEMRGYENTKKNLSLPLRYPVLSARDTSDVPICVVGNGASLDMSIAFLRENRENMLIFSAGTALRTLIKQGIIPDFHIEIERTDYLAPILTEAGIEGIDLIGASVIDESVLQTTGAEIFLFYKEGTIGSYLDEPSFVLPFAAPFVGNAACSLALTFSRRVILCGMDVGYKKEGKIHSRDSIYENETQLPPDSIPVRANFDESQIYTNDLFSLSRHYLRECIGANPDATVVNMSDGAYIEGTIPVKRIALKPIDKQTAITRIKNCFSVKTDTVYTSKTSDDMSFFTPFRKETMTIMYRQVRDRGDVFAMMRDMEIWFNQAQQTHKKAFYLLHGSLRHLLFSLYISLLHTKKEHISEEYTRCVAFVHEWFESVEADFAAFLARRRTASLLQGITLPL